jgi:tetratricopeptide (TPR) repeat protein
MGQQAIQLAPSVDPDLQAELFYSAAVYFNQYALYARGEEYARTAIAMARSTGDNRTFVRAVNSLAFVLLRQMRAAEAIPLLDSSKPLALELGDPGVIVLVLVNLAACQAQNGQVHEAVASKMAALHYKDRMSEHEHSVVLKDFATGILILGRHGEALSLIEQAIAIQEKIASSPQFLAGFWNTKAWICNMLGKPEHSLQCSEEATRIATAGNYAGALEMASSARGVSLALLGDLEQARTTLVDAIARLEARENVEQVFECQQWMCWICLEDPESPASARVWLERLLARRRMLNRPSVPRLLEAAAMYLARTDRHLPAAATWLHAERLRAEMGVVRFPAEEPHAKTTLEFLAGVFGANWRGAVGLPPSWTVPADPLDWLVEFLASRVDSTDSFVPATSGEIALEKRSADTKHAT